MTSTTLGVPAGIAAVMTPRAGVWEYRETKNKAESITNNTIPTVFSCRRRWSEDREECGGKGGAVDDFRGGRAYCIAGGRNVAKKERRLDRLMLYI